MASTSGVRGRLVACPPADDPAFPSQPQGQQAAPGAGGGGGAGRAVVTGAARADVSHAAAQEASASAAAAATAAAATLAGGAGAGDAVGAAGATAAQSALHGQVASRVEQGMGKAQEVVEGLEAVAAGDVGADEVGLANGCRLPVPP
jgi:hypothetical protein